MERSLIFLADMHFELGLIGVDEYTERIEVARWLTDEDISANDPREAARKDTSRAEDEKYTEYENSIVCKIDEAESGESKNEELWIAFLCLGIWVFTKSDPDPYPSVPHGHFKNKNTAWPKLNPYTGRVFAAKHQENSSMRLSKSQLQVIWRDEKFKSFCREMIIWYQGQYPQFRFPVRHPLRFPRR